MGLIRLREEHGRLYLPSGSLADVIADFPIPVLVQSGPTSLLERDIEDAARTYTLANAYLPGKQVSVGPSDLTPVHFYAVKNGTQRAVKK